MKKSYLIIILFSFSLLAFSQDQIVFVRLDKYWQIADLEELIVYPLAIRQNQYPKYT